MSEKLSVLVVGVGQMGLSHALGYREIEGWEIAGMVIRSPQRQKKIGDLFPGVRMFKDFDTALRETAPDAVSINTYPDTHAELAIKSMKAGSHVFVEKPLADNVADAQAVVKAAQTYNRKLVVGYILNHHPAWRKFVEVSRTLGKPLVMRMNLLQQSSSESWLIHKNMLGAGLQPIVDCGIHYIDVMCQMVAKRPIKVNAMSAKLSDEIAISNYGQLQLYFEDGSIGWYEAGYGPSLSETAFFVKDVIGPKGSVSIVNKPLETEPQCNSISSDINSHTQANFLRLHHATLDSSGAFAKEDEWIQVEDEPNHNDLCKREQEYFLNAILNDDDLSDHMQNAIVSLEIVLAADESSKTGMPVNLSNDESDNVH